MSERLARKGKVGAEEVADIIGSCFPAATQTALMESAAGGGEILISPGTARRIDRRFVGSPAGPGFLLKGRHLGTPQPPTAPDARGLDLASGVPIAIRTHLLEGGDYPEHRRAHRGLHPLRGCRRDARRSGAPSLRAATVRPREAVQA